MTAKNPNLTLVAPQITIDNTVNGFTLHGFYTSPQGYKLSIWQGTGVDQTTGPTFTFNSNKAGIADVMWIQNGNLDYSGNSGVTGFYEAQNVKISGLNGNSYVMSGAGRRSVRPRLTPRQLTRRSFRPPLRRVPQFQRHDQLDGFAGYHRSYDSHRHNNDPRHHATGNHPDGHDQRQYGPQSSSGKKPESASSGHDDRTGVAIRRRWLGWSTLEGQHREIGRCMRGAS